MSKWKLPLLLTVVFAILLAGCGKEKSNEEKVADAIKEAFGTSAPVAETGSTEDTLGEISNFVISDLWNNGFVNISWYINSGTGSTGETLDIDFLMDRLAKSMEKKSEYDAFVNGLGDDYSDIKTVWTKLSSEADRLYEYVKQNPPKANSKDDGFDAGVFEQYSDAFDQDVTDLMNQK